ncbi:MAG: hypothetical protein U1A27_13345 [Phycisphaerae bacterium]
MMAGLATAGCNARALEGSWKAVDAPAETEAFRFKQIELRDGRYFASAAMGEQNLFLRGRYQFNGLSLTLRPDDGPPQQFQALLWLSRELRLSARDFVQRLKRQ